MAELIGGATATVTINSVDLSDHITSATLELSADEVENTAFGDSARTFQGGLQSGVLSATFNQDYASSEVDATLNGLVGSTTAFTFKPTSAATSATNPSYDGTVLVTAYSPVSAETGTLASFSVSWPVTGALTRTVS